MTESRFEGGCAWDLAGRIEHEPLGELTLDFSQCGAFVDYGIAVLATALLSIPDKTIHLEGLRRIEPFAADDAGFAVVKPLVGDVSGEADVIVDFWLSHGDLLSKG